LPQFALLRATPKYNNARVCIHVLFTMLRKQAKSPSLDLYMPKLALWQDMQMPRDKTDLLPLK